MFVFAFFITRRNASQSGEGKKECEEKRFVAHVMVDGLIVANGVNLTAASYGVNKKRARRRVRSSIRWLTRYSSCSGSSIRLTFLILAAVRFASPLC
ncbi:hypothetical protein B4914_18725 [Yersinia entomophaga]|nr:hypothetical protein B4914_18725 [Yersinia entomophaga]